MRVQKKLNGGRERNAYMVQACMIEVCNSSCAYAIHTSPFHILTFTHLIYPRFYRN